MKNNYHETYITVLTIVVLSAIFPLANAQDEPSKIQWSSNTTSEEQAKNIDSYIDILIANVYSESSETIETSIEEVREARMKLLSNADPLRVARKFLSRTGTPIKRPKAASTQEYCQFISDLAVSCQNVTQGILSYSLEEQKKRVWMSSSSNEFLTSTTPLTDEQLRLKREMKQYEKDIKIVNEINMGLANIIININADSTQETKMAWLEEGGISQNEMCMDVLRQLDYIN